MKREYTERTEMLVGSDGVQKLASSRVLVFGAGGVGGYVVEFLARAGIGAIGIVDNDVIKESNLNRQILATTYTIGQKKIDAARDRILSINPDCEVITYDLFYLPETANQIRFDGYDYIVDAIDTVTAKVKLALMARAYEIPIVSSMGTGNKLKPRFEVKDVYLTTVCPLARVMRRELRNIGIARLNVAYSTEEPVVDHVVKEDGRYIPGSISYVPAAAAAALVGQVVEGLLK